NGNALSVQNGSLNDAAPLALSANGGDSALWRLMPSSGGSVALLNKRSGQLVNIPGPSKQAGAKLIQYYDDGQDNSRWRVTPVKNGVVALVSRYDDQAIDVQGDTVVQSPRGDGLGQQWRLVPVR
ncbi:MAG: RICIN domain-containing protein, partial [Armatimonadota bacterium]|nr:RICIN domain-containing protein [Armatimonadota bacterium]